ncbi:hypothetical protein tb265_17890 [Gemmatimonadetes bacterium T265]|nr:hypothetical protein tb265_17890 [Gemmatimonadetes bacterium T265]
MPPTTSNRGPAGAPPAAWVPAAWDDAPALGAPAPSAAAGTFAGDWAAAPAPPPARLPTPNAFDALPDFGATSAMRAAWHAGDSAWAALVADAADEREAQVRLDMEAARAAELAVHEAAHAEALGLAWADGHAAGCAAGDADARAALADVAAAFDAAARELRAHEERWMGDLRAHVAALAVAVAHHVVGREVAADDALVVALAARAVAEFPVQEALVARVHPDDLDALKTAWDATAREGAVRWAPDERVARGGAVVEGRERIVDGRVDTALERLYRALAGHVA